MKLNVASPINGTQKIVEVEDVTKLLPFFEHKIGHEVAGDSLGDEFKGYVFRITGGNDKQGFPMMQGVLVQGRSRLLFRPGMKCFKPLRNGHRKRKSVRGCIVGPDLSVLCLAITKKGEQEIEGLTNVTRPRRLGPKRANRIRKLFGLSKEDDVRKCVPRRAIEREGKPTRWKAPKIQRLLTPKKIARQRRLKKLEALRKEKSSVAKRDYLDMMTKWKAELQKKEAGSRPTTPVKPVAAAPAPAAPAKKAAPAATQQAAAPKGGVAKPKSKTAKK